MDAQIFTEGSTGVVGGGTERGWWMTVRSCGTLVLWIGPRGRRLYDRNERLRELLYAGLV